MRGGEAHPIGFRQAILLLVIAVWGCTAPEPPKAPQVLRIAYPSTINSLDPLSETTLISVSIFARIYDSLVVLSPELQVRPSLATHWSSPDEKTWVFELRRDVVFHDGTPFTAEDVKFSIERVKNNPSTMQSSALTLLDHVEVVSPYTIRMVTREPAGNFVRRIYAIAIVSHKSNPQSAPVGSGQYRVKNWEPGRYIHMEANDTYWGRKPVLREVRFEAIDRTEDLMKQFLAGEIDIVPQLEPETVDRHGLLERKDIVLRTYPGLLVMYLAFDTAHRTMPPSSTTANPFRDARVRRAVYQAINTERLIQEIQRGYAVEATQLVSPLVYGYNPAIRRLPYSPEESRRYLREAGYPSGFAVRLDIPNDRYRADVEAGNAVVEDLGKIGIRVELNPQSKDAWMKLRMENRTPFFLAGWMVTSGDAAGALDYLVHTPEDVYGYGRSNSGGYSNPEIDRVIEASSRATGKQRLKLLEKAMAMAMNDVVAVPLYVEQNLAAHRAGLQWEPRADGVMDPSSISLKPD